MVEIRPTHQVRPPEDYRALDETRMRLATECRTPGFRSRWLSFARWVCAGNQAEAEDVLQDTFRGIWDGTRRWPKEVPWTSYLSMTMRSVRNNRAKKQPFVVIDCTDENAVSRVSTNLASAGDVEETAYWHALNAKVEQALDVVPGLLEFHRLRLNDVERADIIARLGLSEQEYDALHKRHLRHTKKALLCIRREA